MPKQLLRWAITILLVIAVVGVRLYFLLNGVLDQIPRIDPDETFSVTEQTTAATQKNEETDATLPSDTTCSTEPADVVPTDDNVINILLIGHNGNNRKSTGTTNTMLLCTLNKSLNKLTLTSFHSDLWVYIPGHGDQVLCQSGKLGGVKLLNETLVHNFGIKADYNIMIDLHSFADAIDAIGGIDVTLLEGEAQCLNSYALRDSAVNEKWDLEAGKNTLTGMQVLSYSRMEERGTDFGRTDRQRIVVSAMLSKLKTLDIDTAAAHVNALLKMVSTDMTNDQIIALIADLIVLPDGLQIVSQNIPTNGNYALDTKGDSMVLTMTKEQLEQNRKHLAALCGE